MLTQIGRSLGKTVLFSHLAYFLLVIIPSPQSGFIAL